MAISRPTDVAINHGSADDGQMYKQPNDRSEWGEPMSSSHFIRLSCCFSIVLALCAGCGGSGESDPVAEGDDSAATSPPPAEGQLQPGQPAVDPEVNEKPVVEIATTAGTFRVTLHRNLVPRTVDNFLRYVDEKFYDGTIIHQVIRDYAILGGNFKMDGGNILEKQAAGVGINNEASKGLSNKRGTIAMAREPENADSARCQFFINLVDNTSLDAVPPEDGVPEWQTAGYCAFGTVNDDDMAVLDKIGQVKVSSVKGMDRVPVETITIISIRRL